MCPAGGIKAHSEISFFGGIMPVSLVDIATMTASCSRMQTYQKFVLSSLFVVVRLFLLAGKGNLGGVFSVAARWYG